MRVALAAPDGEALDGIRAALADHTVVEDGSDGDVNVEVLQTVTSARVKALADRDSGAPPVLVILTGEPTRVVLRGLAEHASGLLMAADAPNTLGVAVQAAAAGLCVIPAELRRSLRRPPLSPREKQVLALLVIDYSNAEIARTLHLTEPSVKNHLTAIFAKLGVSSRSEAVQRVIDPGMGLGVGILHLTDGDETE